MDRTKIETHRVEQGAVKATAGTLPELNLSCVSSDAPVNEMAPRLKKRIGSDHGLVDRISANFAVSAQSDELTLRPLCF